MNNLNSIIIEGNLTRDPLLRTTTTGKIVCSFSIASNRYYKQGTNVAEEVSFFDVETWSRLAESCSALGHKGRGVKVVGSVRQDRWKDPEGKPRSKVKIVAEHVEFRPEFNREATVQGVPAEAGAMGSVAAGAGTGVLVEEMAFSSAMPSAEEMAAVTF